MCRLCDQGQPQAHDNDDGGRAWNPRRGFLKAGAAAGGAGAMAMFANTNSWARSSVRLVRPMFGAPMP